MAAECNTLIPEVVNVHEIQHSEDKNIVLISEYSETLVIASSPTFPLFDILFAHLCIAQTPSDLRTQLLVASASTLL